MDCRCPVRSPTDAVIARPLCCGNRVAGNLRTGLTMEMIPIEGSSNIAAIGYAPDVQLLQVRYRDGAQYQWLNVSPEAHAALMAAPSKGAHLVRHFPAGTRCFADGGEIKLREPYIVGETPSKPLETFQPDDCCQSRLMKANRAGDSWSCDKCGQEWRVNIVGGIRHWTPFDEIMVW